MEVEGEGRDAQEVVERMGDGNARLGSGRKKEGTLAAEEAEEMGR